jgi:hypothetical protein
MKLKIFIVFLVIFNFLSVLYLISPTPKLKDLPNSAKSDQPGDTTQLANVSAYYTNLSRADVMNFYKSNYQGLFRINLNHPPEKAKTIIRDTIQTYYLEELVLPFKESIFINGYEWQNDVFTKPEKRIVNKLIYHDVVYSAKITIKTFPTSITKRIISFMLTEGVIISMYFIYRSFFKKSKQND